MVGGDVGGAPGLSSGRWVSLVGALLLACTSVAGCTSDEEPPGPVVPERSWDVIGVVAGATHLPGYETTGGAITQGDPRTGHFTVGPMDVEMADGSVLHVPAETPGGNACLPLMTSADRRFATGQARDDIPDEAVVSMAGLSDGCVVIAALDPNGSVARFQILSTDPLGRADVGDLVERRRSGYLTGSGFVFDLAPDAEVVCNSEAVDVDSFLEPGRWSAVSVDVESGEIAAIKCVGLG